jgi:hypothetical protein
VCGLDCRYKKKGGARGTAPRAPRGRAKATCLLLSSCSEDRRVPNHSRPETPTWSRQPNRTSWLIIMTYETCVACKSLPFSFFTRTLPMHYDAKHDKSGSRASTKNATAHGAVYTARRRPLGNMICQWGGRGAATQRAPPVPARVWPEHRTDKDLSAHSDACTVPHCASGCTPG